MRYYIAPLDITERQELIYRAIYKKADFRTMESTYTYELIKQDIKLINITEKQVRNDIKKLIELGALKVIKKGTKGNPTIYNINILEKIREINGQTKDANKALISEQLHGIHHTRGMNKTSKSQLKVSSIKDKDKETNIYTLVISKLNDLTNKNYKDTSLKARSCIDARLKEGFVVEDFYKVIEVKSNEWLGTTMEIYLRPETLFGNKFEGYLNQSSNIKNQRKAETPKSTIDFSKMTTQELIEYGREGAYRIDN